MDERTFGKRLFAWIDGQLPAERRIRVGQGEGLFEKPRDLLGVALLVLGAQQLRGDAVALAAQLGGLQPEQHDQPGHRHHEQCRQTHGQAMAHDETARTIPAAHTAGQHGPAVEPVPQVGL